MIIKKIFYCIIDSIFSKVRQMRRWYSRHFSTEAEMPTDSNTTFTPYHYHRDHQELTTYYVLSNEEDGDIDVSPKPIYPLSNSYIQQKFPFLYNSLTQTHTQTQTQTQTNEKSLSLNRTNENRENHEDANQIEYEEDLTNAAEDRNILTLLHDLKRKNEELIKYLPKNSIVTNTEIP